MPLKNTYTKTPIATMLTEIQKALLRVKASDMSYKFDGSGKIVGMRFSIPIQGKDIGFMLPISLEKVRSALRKEQNRRANDDDYVYRVAWACMRDWVVAQLALLETEMAEPLQVFLPYAYDSSGKTLYESVKDSPMLLGPTS